MSRGREANHLYIAATELDARAEYAPVGEERTPLDRLAAALRTEGRCDRHRWRSPKGGEGARLGSLAPRSGVPDREDELADQAHDDRGLRASRAAAVDQARPQPEVRALRHRGCARAAAERRTALRRRWAPSAPRRCGVSRPGRTYSRTVSCLSTRTCSCRSPLDLPRRHLGDARLEDLRHPRRARHPPPPSLTTHAAPPTRATISSAPFTAGYPTGSKPSSATRSNGGHHHPLGLIPL
jgi:hypothetical protein